MNASHDHPKLKGITPAAQRLLKQAHGMLTRENDVLSPCVSVCRMSERTQLCEGCWRTLDEIASWSHFSQAQKRAVWTLLTERIYRHFSRP